MLIDTHCHLDARSVGEHADEVLERARAAAVRAFVAIGVGGVASVRETLALAHRHADVVATVGVHPHEASRADAIWAEVAGDLGDARVVALGETGLDYHYDHSPRDAQAVAFREQIALARRWHLPLVIHTRSAPEDTLRILETEQARDVGGIIHCFSEDRSFAKRALDLGFDLSFSGIVTFKNARSVHDVARWAPEDRILVETDSPYLAPVPLRGRRCEPAHVVHTAAQVAALRGISLERLSAATRDNACRRFGPRLAAALASCKIEGGCLNAAD